MSFCKSEYQIKLYLLILMNIGGLTNVNVFLVHLVVHTVHFVVLKGIACMRKIMSST